MPLPSTRNAA
uniref:Uncharacterized protein n=1 Tax=Vitis vinifera TaxID=29760 RepID=F6HE10_VITVI